MIGIYKITNLINEKVYIGQSINIEERIKEHKRIPYRKNRPTYFYPLYVDMRAFGIENFKFEILEETTLHDLNKKEQEYIQKYNSYLNGYNQTYGGDSSGYGDKSNHHILSEDDVYNIRIRYKNKEARWNVYQDYKEKVSLDTFSHVWLGKTWKWLMPEVFTPENIEWHKQNLGDPSLVSLSKIDLNSVKEIRQKKKFDFSRKEVYYLYKDILSESAFNAIWYNKSWKGVE